MLYSNIGDDWVNGCTLNFSNDYLILPYCGTYYLLHSGFVN